MARYRQRIRYIFGVLLPGALLATGLFVGPLRSSEWSWRAALHLESPALAELDPVRALPRTGVVLATLEAQRQLESGRPYAAWQALRDHLDLDLPVGYAANLLAARAAAEWGGWREVREVLQGRIWLDQVAGAEGVFLLARAEEELGNLSAATGAYQRYLAAPSARETGVAQARLGQILSRRGEYAAAAHAFAAAAQELPEVADWLSVFQIEALVDAGDPASTALATHLSGGSAPVRARRVQLEAQGWITSAETDRAILRLEWESRVLRAEGAHFESGQLRLMRARLLLGASDEAAGREELRLVAADGLLPAAVRIEAAHELVSQPGKAVEEQLAIAAAFEAGNRPGLAARALRSAFDSGGLASVADQLRLARLLYDERDFGPARNAYLRVAPSLEDREARAEAELYAARALYRSGGSAAVQRRQQATAISELRQIIARYEGTASSGTALFLLGDDAATTEAGLSFYRRAAAVEHSPDAREALARVGDRSMRLGDRAGAIRAWEEYVRRYPQGEESARLAYETGKLLRTAGRRAEAERMFELSMHADPVSYHAVRAAEQIGQNPLDHILREPNPWIGLASEPAEAADVLARMDRLDSLGMQEAREAEYQAALRRFRQKPLALIVLAEGVRDRNRPVEAIQLGRQLLQQRAGVWDERLLRVVFPFPYRALIESEARRAGIDPLLYAGLVRQESSFRADARSWVGATGLGQIMPATGRWLAPAVGIRNYDDSLLRIPELNLRMGTKYFGDLMRRYDDAADLALAGYNAGPGRADRWKRQFNYGRDLDAFRASIPFDETRNYVMIVLRNAAVYQRLYGGQTAPALAVGD